MSIDDAATCVAYDDTRVACVVGTATGAIVFRERAVANRSVGAEESADAASWPRVARERVPSASSITAIALADASCGRVVAAASSSGELSFWRARSDSNGDASLELAGALAVDGGVSIHALAFAPSNDGTIVLAAAGADGMLRFYEPREKTTATVWETTGEHESARPNGTCTALAWRRASERTGIVDFAVLALGTSWESDATHSVSVLARDEKMGRWRVVDERADGLTSRVSCLAWSATTTARGALNLVAACGSKCAVYEFEGVTTSGVSKATELGRLNHPCEVNSADWNASGSVIATAATDGKIRFWSANLKDGAWREQEV